MSLNLYGGATNYLNSQYNQYFIPQRSNFNSTMTSLALNNFNAPAAFAPSVPSAANPFWAFNYPATYPLNYYTQGTRANVLTNVPSDIKTQSPAGNWRLNSIVKTPYGDNMYKYTLKNGQQVVLTPRKNATTIIKTFVDAGAMNENDYNRGISHFNEHNVFNGSKRLEAGRFFKEVGRLGAETNASTDYAQTDFYIMSPIVDNKTLKEIIELHSDMLVNPTFPADKVEKEKGPVTSEISMVNDDITNLALNDLVKNLFQIKSNSNNLVAGSIETVSRITRDDVYNHWKKHFTPDNMYTVLTGDFDPNEAIELISQNFTTPAVVNAESKRTKEVLTPTNKSIRMDYISPNDSSTNVFCAFAGPTPDNRKDAIALTALGLILLGNNSARLTKELNDFYALGDFDAQKVGLRKSDPKAVMFQFATQKGDDSKALDKFYDSIESIKHNSPTADEMQIMKNTLLKSLASSFENSESITDAIGSSLLGGNFDTLSDYKTIIENLTPADIVNVANKYLDFGKMSVAVVHPYNTTEDEIVQNYKNSSYAAKVNTVTNVQKNTASKVPLTSASSYIGPSAPAFKSGYTYNALPLNNASVNPNIYTQNMMAPHNFTNWANIYPNLYAPFIMAKHQEEPKGRVISTDNVKAFSLPDNTACALNNSKSENCYLDWRLSCKDMVPVNSACSYVLTQILNDGSKYKSKADFTHEASLKSVMFDTEANSFQIRTSANCRYENLNDAISTMKEAIYSPRLTQRDFDAAVKKVRTYCASMNKDASINLLSKLYGKYFPSPRQILKDLDKLTLNDVKSHYNNLINNSAANLVVTAPFEAHPELENVVRSGMTMPNQHFKPYKPQLLPSFVPNRKAVVLIDTEERNQAQIFKNYSFNLEGNIQDEIKYELLNTILGGTPSSRLFQDLRETEKLAYAVSSKIQSFENSGIITLEILSTTDDKKQNDIKYDNLQKCLDGFERHTNKLKTEYVSDEELEAAKNKLKQKIAYEMELPSTSTDLLSMNMTQPYGIKRIDEYVRMIDKITKQDIMNAANRAFAGKPVYSILASQDTIENQKKYINRLGEVVWL